jgi:hypothetical protein
MKEIITMCGYRCDICPAYAVNIRTARDAKNAAEGFFKYYGFRIDPDTLACAGCLNEGRHIDTDCPVRPCAVEKKMGNCARCPEFKTCEKLKTRMDFLESIPEKVKNIPPQDYDRFVTPYQSKPRMIALRKESLGS